MREYVDMLAALGHESRLDIFRRLVRAGARGSCVDEIRRQLQVPGSTLSHHLDTLTRCGLLASTREGRFIYYAVDWEKAGALLRFLTEDCCADSPAILDTACCADGESSQDERAPRRTQRSRAEEPARAEDEERSMTQNRDENVHELVRDRYAEIARAGKPVPESGCCGPRPAQIAERLGYDEKDVQGTPEGANLGLGCGAPLGQAALRPGETVLDLGSGAGFDAFLAAREVGESGRVIGVDMTPEMLEKARANATAGGFSNVEFRHGFIEDLPVESGSVDVIISNCVINLAPDKAAVYREVARVLRPGGRMLISDVVLDAPLPPEIANDVAALTGCVAGAALRADYLKIIADAGLGRVEVLNDRSFGSMALDMVPDDMMQQAKTAGIDVRAVAETVRSLTLRAYKPA